ncbi:MAG: hypothetical protein COW89_00940 [Nitrospinae bacterium CG22_combo_CG10-13_8_21_14_all_47_10]|nr:MAG: hypothetical protein COW89_00940 [Nitrospinae bacterium CG22_combo_CG10-13_8_21_14_all_47_10]
MMVENFGSYLKHERELRGVPLEEIAGTTKIHIRFLKALEENSFDELPGEVFVKGFIRSYANTIGSDVEEILNIYKESVELKRQEPPSLPPSSGIQTKTILTFGLLILLIVGSVFGVRTLIKKGDSQEGKVPFIQKQAETTLPEPPVNSDILVVQKNVDVEKAESAPPETPELPIDSPKQMAEDLNEKKVLPPQEVPLDSQNSAVSRIDPSPPSPADMEKPLKLTIRANENSWFNMTIDDFREEDFILPAGTAKTFWGNDVFRLTVGNRTGVKLFLNGVELILPEGKDRVVKDFIINSKLVE